MSTVATFTRQLHDEFGWDFPADPPAGTVLGRLWALEVTVAKDPSPGVVYLATATASFGFGGQGLAGILWIQVLDGGAARAMRSLTLHSGTIMDQDPTPGTQVTTTTTTTVATTTTDAPAAAAGDPPARQVLFGVNLTIRDQPVSVVAKDVLNIKKNGIEFTLPDPVHLGKIDDLTDWLDKEYGVSTAFLDDLPSPLNTVKNRITSLEFTVEKLHVKIPPAAKPAEPAANDDPAPASDATLYTLAMSALWPTDPITIVKGFQVNGVVFGVTNEPQDDTPSK